MPTYRENAARQTLPLIPLRGIVAFPGNNINIELEREISKKACDAALASDMVVFLVTQKDTRVDEPGSDDLYLTGTVARLRQSVKHPKTGVVRIVAEGFCRATLTDMRMSDGYYTADVITKTVTADFSSRDIRTEAMLAELMESLGEMLRYRPAFSQNFEIAARSINSSGASP